MEDQSIITPVQSNLSLNVLLFPIKKDSQVVFTFVYNCIQMYLQMSLSLRWGTKINHK